MKNFRRHVRRRSADFGGVLVLVQMNGEAEVNQLKRSTRLRTETFGAVVRHTGDRRSGPCELGGPQGLVGERGWCASISASKRAVESHMASRRCKCNECTQAGSHAVCVFVSAMRGAQRCVLYRLVFVKQVLRLESRCRIRLLWMKLSAERTSTTAIAESRSLHWRAILSKSSPLCMTA